jgi:prepilin-type processing-associated H-X9-DG protein
LSCAQYSTFNTPNSGIDSNQCSNQNLPAPCVYNGSTTFNTARSKHPGGVNTVFGDGSIHFIADSIDISVWQAVGSMSGNEVIGGNQLGL